MSTNKKTLRMLMQDLYTAHSVTRAIRAQITTGGSDSDELVPDQVMPEPLVFASFDEEQECVGSRPQPEILDLLYEGVALSLEVGTQEYEIAYKDGTFLFKVWCEEGSTLTHIQTYDSLEALLQAEGSRPCLDLGAFVVIG